MERYPLTNIGRNKVAELRIYNSQSFAGLGLGKLFSGVSNF